MGKTRKVLSIVLVLMMLVSGFAVANVKAATTISYAPNPKVEYGYSSGVTTGTIRYISQIRGSAYFNSNYWGNWESQAGIECGTASISMALSYVGVNKTPKAILDAHSGTTYFTGWGPTTSNPSVANGMNNYINGNGKYSPPIVHFTTGYASGSHYVILIGKVSSSSYLVLDPASNSTWTLSTSDAKYKSINQVFQYYNASASIVPDIKEPTTILYPTSGATYKIASGVGNNMYLDFSLSTINVQIYEDCDKSDNVDWVKSQYFTLNHVGDGWYTITNIGNGKLVDVALGDPASGTNIQQCAANGNNAQLYRFYDAGDGYCYIKSKLGTYVDVQNGDNFNNANVWAYTFNGTNAQKWKLIKKDVPTFDTEKPSISNVRITDINESGFTISCEVYDNIGIKQVLFPVWTTEALGPSLGVEAGQDDIVYHKATMNGNTATCRINISDHNNSYGEYVCDPHIYDTSDNLLISGRLHINVPKFVAHCEGLAPLYTYDVSKNDSIEVSIWAFNLTGDEVDCYYQIDNGQLVYIERGSRPDVVRVHPECKQIDCGFGLRLDASTFSEGTHNIKILAKSNGAEQYLFENNFVVVKPTFTASFNANGGACSTSYKSVKCGNTYGNLPTPTRTGYTFDGWYTSATGGTKVTSSSKVAATSNHTLYAHWTCNHSSTELRNVATATCTSVGYSGDTFCKTCSKKIKNGTEIEKAPHTDTNSDKICDVCSEVLGSITPDTPEEPAIDCSCNCHKGGIAGFFFKIILFFQRIFGMNKECACGIAHY